MCLRLADLIRERMGTQREPDRCSEGRRGPCRQARLRRSRRQSAGDGVQLSLSPLTTERIAEARPDSALHLLAPAVKLKPEPMPKTDATLTDVIMLRSGGALARWFPRDGMFHLYRRSSLRLPTGRGKSFPCRSSPQRMESDGNELLSRKWA